MTTLECNCDINRNLTDPFDARCALCDHWPEEHQEGSCSGCDAGGFIDQIEHEYIACAHGFVTA